ncbi:MAG: Hsp20/alpha crystallin family protein [Bryobacteraceae bacterium]|nr:Hsp20/alpha crystallin family protein [Bryobacteraceae bacterium]
MSEKPTHLAMFYSAFAQPAREITWRPAADVYRTRGGWVLKFELAGVQLDDISVSVLGSSVTVSGVRRDRMVEEDCWHYSMEISYSKFERTVHLPCEVGADDWSVEYKNGLLLVRVNLEGERK